MRGAFMLAPHSPLYFLRKIFISMSLPGTTYRKVLTQKALRYQSLEKHGT
jgi:hypothetical protein